jgi:hypothetical protein
MKLLDIEPRTMHEGQLQAALQASNDVITLQKQVMAGMQAQMVLQSMYLEGVQGQLQAQEEKKLKKRKTGKINMDGHAKILTQDDIIDGVKEWQDCQDKAVEDAASKKKGKRAVQHGNRCLEIVGVVSEGAEWTVEGWLGGRGEKMDC